MSPRALRKVLAYVFLFLALYGLGLIVLLLLPLPWGLAGAFLWLTLFAGSALFLLDMMVPGINLLSTAPTRLPAPAGNDVALTFDDGPVEPYTREILDILDRYEAKATFFCLGKNVDQNPDLAREIVKRGHAIANHTYGHKILPFLSSAEQRDEIKRGAESILQATGREPTLLRCPKGYKSRRVTRAVTGSGARLVGFSYPIFDVQNPPPEQLVRRVLSRVKAGDIVLMHDGYAPHCPGKRDSLVAALPAILDGFSKKGLRTVTLDRAFSPLMPAAR
jgi:peptidoglycan-N-acetylglucosamine deacetylase